MQPCHQPCNQTTAAAIRSPNAKLVDFCFGRNQLDCACRVDWKTVKAIREYLQNRSAKRRQCRQWNHQRTPLPHCQLVGKCVSRPFVTLLCRVLFSCICFFFFVCFRSVVILFRTVVGQFVLLVDFVFPQARLHCGAGFAQNAFSEFTLSPFGDWCVVQLLFSHNRAYSCNDNNYKNKCNKLFL